MKEYIYRDKNTGEILFSHELIDDPELELLTAYKMPDYEDSKQFYKSIPLAKLALDILRRKRKITFEQLFNEISRLNKEAHLPHAKLLKILSRFETYGIVLKVGNYYYAIQPTEFISRRSGEKMNRTRLAIILGIPYNSIKKFTEIAIDRGWLEATSDEGIYLVPSRIWKISLEKLFQEEPKMHGHGTSRKIILSNHTLMMDEHERQITEEVLMKLKESGRCIIKAIVFTTCPEKWDKDRINRLIERFLQSKKMHCFRAISELLERITSGSMKIYEHYDKYQVDVKELPNLLNLDEVDLYICNFFDNNVFNLIHCIRRIWGWELYKWKLLTEEDQLNEDR